MSGKIILKVFALSFLAAFLLVKSPMEAWAAIPFTSAYVTLSNSRFSFKGQISANVGINTSTVTINTNGPDVDVNNLFPGDTICFHGVLSVNGCNDQTTSYKVSNNITSTIVGFSPTKVTQTNAGDNVVSTQSAILTVTFKPSTNVPSGGQLVLTLPAVSGSGTTAPPNDGIPDSTGFDANLLPANLGGGSSVTGETCAGLCYVTTGFTVSAVTLTSASSLQTITATLGVTLVSNTQYSFQVGKTGSSKLVFINPAPTSTSHVRGVADTYSVTLSTKDGSGNTLDSTIMKVAPIDGVFVSVTVEETITYTIANVGTGTANPCNNQGGGSTASNNNGTAYSVPFGSIVLGNTFSNMAQSHSIVTNASGGYVVTVQEDAILSKDGNGTVTIPDTLCDAGTCTTSSATGWTTASNNGFGYTLANLTGTDAAFTAGAGVYKPFSTSAVGVMSKTSPTSSSQVYSCYRVSVSPTQNTGYYFNKLIYIATPKF